MENSSTDFFVVQGSKTDSGNDMVYDHMANKDNHPDGMVLKNWMTIGGAKLVEVPEKLYFASRGDKLIVAYDKKKMTVLAYWNETKKEGTSVNFLGLIFHPNALVAIGVVAGFIYYIGKEHIGSMMNYYAMGAGFIGIAYIFSFFKWKVKLAAQNKVNELKK